MFTRSNTGLRALWIASKQFKGYLTCSNCTNCFIEPEWLENGKWNYCPSCGARMMEEKK
jgi:DNA-directed RNA polymerase subunit RPC12/RpoP